jgi:ureidoglycolate dehydrogenase (NAD+)
MRGKMILSIVVSAEQLKQLCIHKFMACGVGHEDASIVSDVLIHANLRGVNSHGVLRVEHYVRKLKEGGIKPTPHIMFDQKTSSTGVVDGDDGLGHLVMYRAMQHAIELDTHNGVSVITAKNSSHCGALSYFVQMAAEQGMIGMAVTNTDKMVVPFGGKAPFFGTNPIAFSFPAQEHDPIILDMATSSVAYGKILDARLKGGAIPNSWGVDADGHPTSDPNAVVALTPFGGPKGYGLSLVIDLLSSVLSESPYGPHVPPMYGDNYSEPRKLGHFLMVINPAIFTPFSTFIQTMDKFIHEIHEIEPAEGFTRVMLPGEPEANNEKQRRIHGIALEESLYHYLSTN